MVIFLRCVNMYSGICVSVRQKSNIDNPILRFKYTKGNRGIWQVTLLLPIPKKIYEKSFFIFFIQHGCNMCALSINHFKLERTLYISFSIFGCGVDENNVE